MDHVESNSRLQGRQSSGSLGLPGRGQGERGTGRWWRGAGGKSGLSAANCTAAGRTPGAVPVLGLARLRLWQRHPLSLEVPTLTSTCRSSLSCPQTTILHSCTTLALWLFSNRGEAGWGLCLCSHHPNIGVATPSSEGGGRVSVWQMPVGSRAHDEQMPAPLPRALLSSSKSSSGMGPDGHTEVISPPLLTTTPYLPPQGNGPGLLRGQE